MKRVMKILGALAIALAFTKGAQAAVTVSDSLTVTITPNAYYALDIDTANVTLNLGSIALGATVQTLSPSTVTIQSTYATTDVKLQGAISGGWFFDADTSDQEANYLAAWATFTDVTRSSAMAQGGDYFSGTETATAGSDVIEDNPRYVGSSATDGAFSLFENGSDFDPINMDGLVPSIKADLWLYFRLTSATTTNAPKYITITLTAVQPN